MAGRNGFYLALNEFDTALTTGAIAGAGGVNGHIAAASQFQQIIALITFDNYGVSTLDLEGYFHILEVLSYLFSPFW
jgi:hypothetical protein